MFVYKCETGNRDFAAYKIFLVEEGENYTVTADDLIKTDIVTQQEFDQLVAEIKATTDDLGISPNAAAVG